jgi:hypothetical protein
MVSARYDGFLESDQSLMSASDGNLYLALYIFTIKKAAPATLATSRGLDDTY